MVHRSPGIKDTRATPTTTVEAMAGRLHFHPCRQCGYSFGCNCQEPLVDGCCSACKAPYHHPRAIWHVSRDPAACCTRTNVEQVVNADLIRLYQLAGPGPWFQCQTCARAHGRIVMRGLPQ